MYNYNQNQNYMHHTQIEQPNNLNKSFHKNNKINHNNNSNKKMFVPKLFNKNITRNKNFNQSSFNKNYSAINNNFSSKNNSNIKKITPKPIYNNLKRNKNFNQPSFNKNFSTMNNNFSSKNNSKTKRFITKLVNKKNVRHDKNSIQFSFKKNQNFNDINYKHNSSNHNSHYSTSDSMNSDYGYAANITNFCQNNNIENDFNNNNAKEYKNILSSAPIKDHKINMKNAENKFNNYKISKIEQAMKQYVNIKRNIKKPNKKEKNTELTEKDKEVISEFIKTDHNIKKGLYNTETSTFETYVSFIYECLKNLKPYLVNQKIQKKIDYSHRMHKEFMGDKRNAIENGIKIASFCLSLITKTNEQRNARILSSLLNNKFEDLYIDFDNAFFMLEDREKKLIKNTMATIGINIPSKTQKTKSDEYLLGDLKEQILLLEENRNKKEIFKYLYIKNEELLHKIDVLKKIKIKIKGKLENILIIYSYLNKHRKLNEKEIEMLNSVLKLIYASLFLYNRNNKNNKYNELLNIIINSNIKNLKNKFDSIFENYSDKNLAIHLKNFTTNLK